ncbi:MAG: type II toxin-antitoxin system ParD family antitoxin [Potamolinea sp.]
MNISLTTEQAKFIQEKIKTGRYSTTAQVINEALRLLEERERHYQTWLEETRQKAAVGIEQLERGEGIDGETVIANLRKKLAKAREADG